MYPTPEEPEPEAIVSTCPITVELEISILACYLPLNLSEVIKEKLKNYISNSSLFNDLIQMHINMDKRPEIKTLITDLGDLFLFDGLIITGVLFTIYKIVELIINAI